MNEERQKKSYDGKMMEDGTINEEVIIHFYNQMSYKVIDNRDKRFAQELDVDFAIQNLEGAQSTTEIKSDKSIHEMGNLFFETERVNHYPPEEEFRFRLGWGWRSPATKLVVRSPKTGSIFVFTLADLRVGISEYIRRVGNMLTIKAIETDQGKTTIGYLIPMQADEIRNLWTRYEYLNNDEFLSE